MKSGTVYDKDAIVKPFMCYSYAKENIISCQWWSSTILICNMQDDEITCRAVQLGSLVLLKETNAPLQGRGAVEGMVAACGIAWRSALYGNLQA